MSVKLRICCLAMLLAVFWAVPDARADQVVFNGSVSAAFNSGPAGSVTTLGPLTFTSVDHFTLLEGRPDCDRCFTPVILGYLSLNGPIHTIPGATNTLNLQLLFDSGVDPNPFILTGMLRIYEDTNGVNVLYPVGPPATFNVGGVQGQLYMTAFLDFLRVGGTVPVYGSGSIAQRNPPLPTPEPATISLLSIGLGGIAWLRRRHRQSGK